MTGGHVRIFRVPPQDRGAPDTIINRNISRARARDTDDFLEMENGSPLEFEGGEPIEMEN